jgi:DNA-binding response OmpR family regulator
MLMDSLRVLLVDDEEELVETLVERLQIRGFRAEGVTRGVDAIQRIREGDFDVVVLDVKMPGLDGLEVIGQLKNDRADVQVILLTGHGSSEDAARGINAGAFDYLIKPVDINELIEIIRKAADR